MEGRGRGKEGEPVEGVLMMEVKVLSFWRVLRSVDIATKCNDRRAKGTSAPPHTFA
jgi:hypothetical protein